jgi:hypothetical protein
MAKEGNINYDNEDFYFTLMRKDGNEVDLIKNGAETKVTN